MKIEVWRKGKLTRTTLEAFTSEGSVYSYLRMFKSPLKTPLRLRLSDELARELLGSERRPCPYVGKEPRKGFYSDGYNVNSRDGFDGLPTVTRHCMSCGYNVVDRYVSIFTHPVTDYLVSSKYRMSFTDAGWDEKRGVLTVDKSDDRLILWIRPVFPISSPGVQSLAYMNDFRAAKEALPNSEILGDRNWVRMYMQPEPATAGNQVRTN